MASVREWQFKRKFRTNAYGWRASSLAIGRLKEAAAEIRSVAKSDSGRGGIRRRVVDGAPGRRSRELTPRPGPLAPRSFAP
jgi:hypothetical protein